MVHPANTIQELYIAHMNAWSDMQHHLGILRYFAERSLNVLELGMRSGVSTSAFLAGRAAVRSVDIVRNDEAVKQLEWLCGEQFSFIQGSSLDVTFPSDLIFFDTLHTYRQLMLELAIHEPNAQRFMVFHDTQTFRTQGEDGSKPGLLAAIEPYLRRGTWTPLLDLDNCCGLMVLERTSGHA